MLRVRTTYTCAVRMISARNDEALRIPILKPRIKQAGPSNPLLELSKPKALRDPLIKGIIVPEYFDGRLLTYPQVLDESKANSIEQLHDKVKRYVDNLPPDQLTKEFTPEIKEQLKSFGAFGALIPKEFGGQGFTFTEFARFMEAFGSNLALASIVLAHNCTAAHPLLRYGSEECKSKFLPKLASGEYVAAFAFAESDCGSDLERCNCFGRQLLSEDRITVNGEKILVTNGEFANLFVTLLHIRQCSAEIDGKGDQLSLLVVERDSPGVLVNKSTALKGLHGNGLASVTFENVEVPEANVLNKTTPSAMKAIIGFHSLLRSSISAAVLGSVRTNFNRLLADVHTRTKNLKLLEQDVDVQHKVLDMAVDLYVMESATYMNAAIADAVDKPDVDLETAVTGLSSIQTALKFAERCTAFYGSETYEKGHFACVLQRDLNCLLWFCNAEKLAKLFISMLGMQFAGAAINQRVKVIRDPLTHFGDFLKLVRQHHKASGSRIDKPSALQQLVHPSLAREANAVAFFHGQFSQVIETTLSTYGAEVFEYQSILEKVTTMIVDVFAVTVALARLSRSVTHGLETAELEKELFDSLLRRTQQRLNILVNENLYVEASIVQTQDDIIERLINDGKYGFEHPLVKNF